MRKYFSIIIAVIFFAVGASVFAQTKGTVTLPSVQGEPGTVVDVPITVSTDSSIGIAQFVVEYKSTVLSFNTAVLGADAPGGFSVSNINTDLPFSPTDPNADENVLVQVSGGGSNSFTGSSQEIVVLQFDVVGNSGESSPLTFDEGASKTYLSTVGLYGIAGDELTFENGGFDVNVPVELSSFNVIAKDQQVVLEWTTESETNNFGFEVQRKQKNIDGFETIGFVDGHGTVAEQIKYRFFDNLSNHGVYYYRLKQIDRDGTFEFSKIQSVDVVTPLNFELQQNYPNPFNPETRIAFTLPQTVNVSIQIYDVAGRLVRTLVDGQVQAGHHQVTWKGRNDQGVIVSSGVYMYQIKTAEHLEIRKLVFAK